MYTVNPRCLYSLRRGVDGWTAEVGGGVTVGRWAAAT